MSQELNSNCPHQADGWCVSCVKTLTNGKYEPVTVITVRLPKTMHEELKEQAHLKRTSLNKLCILKLGFGLQSAKPQPLANTKLPE